MGQKYWLNDAVKVAKAVKDEKEDKEYVFINSDHSTQERHDLGWFTEDNGFSTEDVSVLKGLGYGESVVLGLEKHIAVRVK